MNIGKIKIMTKEHKPVTLDNHVVEQVHECINLGHTIKQAKEN